MTGQQYTSLPLVRVDGADLGPDVRPMLTAVLVEDNVHVPDRFVLRFRDPDRRVLREGGFRIGAEVEVLLSAGDLTEPERLVLAEITGLDAEFDGVTTHTVVRGLDSLHRLFRGQQPRVYNQVTVGDVARDVAQRAGIRVGDVQADGPVLAHVGQGATNDWQFLERLARDSGLETVLVDGRLVLRRPVDSGTAPPAGAPPEDEPLVLELGVDLLAFRSSVSSAEQVAEVQVRGWDVARKQALVGTARAATRSASVGTGPQALAATFGSHQYVAARVPYQAQAEVDTAAGALAEALASSFVEFEGLARGNPRLAAGRAVRLTGVGEPFDGTYTLTSVRHTYDTADGYRTAFTVSGRAEASLLRLAGGGPPDARLPGVAIAQVTDVADPEERLRVRVRLPWLGDDFVTDWARTVQPGAGDGRGFVQLPEVGDEVLVAFEQGDLGRPFVLGGLYNGVDLPPPGPVPVVDPADGRVTRRAWTTRTGHRLEMTEAADHHGVLLATGDDGVRVRLDEHAVALVLHSDGRVTLESDEGRGATVELSGGRVTVTGRGGVTLTDGQGATVELSGGSVTVRGTQIKLN